VYRGSFTFTCYGIFVELCILAIKSLIMLDSLVVYWQLLKRPFIETLLAYRDTLYINIDSGTVPSLRV